jgi:hypothetical protein
MTQVDDTLSRAQASLARAVGRARAGEDTELAQKVRDGGESVAQTLSGMLKMLQVHDPGNRAFDVPTEQLSQGLARLVDLVGPVQLAAVEDQVYVNDVRVRATGKGAAAELGAQLARHNVGGATFHAALEPREVRLLVGALAQAPADVAPRRTLQRALVERGVRSVELLPRLRFRLHGEEMARERDPIEAMVATLRLVGETFDQAVEGRSVSPLPLRRAVVRILDLGPETPELWETLWGAAVPHAKHAASVALVALLVGKAAGLRSAVLQDLGLAALLHDIGYAAVPPEIAPGPEGLARHPAEGARVLLRQRGFHLSKLRRLRAVLDHHRDHLEPRGQPSTAGQILRLAEDYVTLLRVHPSRISPADALGAIAVSGGKIYHPTLGQIMVNALGRYPPGTLLELEDGRYARSVSPVRAPASFDRPLVRIYDLRTAALGGERLDMALGGSVRRVLPG